LAQHLRPSQPTIQQQLGALISRHCCPLLASSGDAMPAMPMLAVEKGAKKEGIGNDGLGFAVASQFLDKYCKFTNPPILFENLNIH
jgi:hypothetical protein